MNPAKLVDPVRDERHFIQQHETALIGEEGLRYSYERALREYKQITVPQERRNFYPIIRYYEKKLFGEVKTECAGAGRRPGKPKGESKPKSLPRNYVPFTKDIEQKIAAIFEAYPTKLDACRSMGYTGSNVHLGNQKSIHKRNAEAINKSYTALVEEGKLIKSQAIERVLIDADYTKWIEYICDHYNTLKKAALASGISQTVLYNYKRRKYVRKTTYEAVKKQYQKLKQLKEL